MSEQQDKGHRGGRGITLNITQEIINLAIPRDSGHCIVADSLSAAVPDAIRVGVDLQSIRFSDPISRRRYIYLTPAVLQKLLVNFDQGILPEPFAVRLGSPAQIKKMEGKREPKPVGGHPTPLPDSGKVVKVSGSEVVVLGGKAPPAAALSNVRGRRRTFGLRSARP